MLRFRTLELDAKPGSEALGIYAELFRELFGSHAQRWDA